jgi:hypothetical protein
MIRFIGIHKSVALRNSSHITLRALLASALSVIGISAADGAVSDVGSYGVGKVAIYLQAGSGTPTLAPLKSVFFYRSNCQWHDRNGAYQLNTDTASDGGGID